MNFLTHDTRRFPYGTGGVVSIKLRSPGPFAARSAVREALQARGVTAIVEA